MFSDRVWPTLNPGSGDVEMKFSKTWWLPGLLVTQLAHATTIIETSTTHSFHGAVINDAGQVAYFASPNNPADDEADRPSIHRNGGLWVQSPYEEIEDQQLVLTSTGVLMFGAYQGEFSIPLSSGTVLSEVGGVYRGPAPQVPNDRAPYLLGDTVYAQRGQSSGGTPVGYTDGGDLLFFQSALFARAPSPPCGNSDQIVTGVSIFGVGVSGRPGKLSAVNNQRYVASVVTAFNGSQADGTKIVLGRYFDFCPGDPGSETFPDLAASTERYFQSVSQISLDEGNMITVLGRRNTDGATPLGIYRISAGGNITIERETDPADPSNWRPVTLSR